MQVKVAIDGRVVKPKSPNEAIVLGIDMVHQHFMLISTLTVAGNIFLSRSPSRKKQRGAKKKQLIYQPEEGENFVRQLCQPTAVIISRLAHKLGYGSYRSVNNASLYLKIICYRGTNFDPG